MRTLVSRIKYYTEGAYSRGADLVSKSLKLAYLKISQKRVHVTFLCLFMIFLFYFVLSLRYTGPTYLSDEASYLTKAAFLAGNNVDNASSWHAGYSMILAPLFMMFSETSHIWRAALFLNSIMLTSSLALLLLLLLRIFPERRYRDVLAVTLICAFYPGMVAMSGYTFSSPLFCLVFMFLLHALMKVDSRRSITTIVPALLCGYLYWVHPMGAAVCIATLVGLLLKSVSEKSYRSLMLFIFLTIFMTGAYTALIHPWINDGMTPVGFSAADHYRSVQSNVSGLTIKGLMFRLPAFVLGQLTYLLVATYGAVLVGASVSVMYLKAIVKDRKSLKNKNLIVFIATLSLLGIVLMGSLLFYLWSITQSIEPDFLIYGRYSEMVLLPLLGIGLLSSWNHMHLHRASIFVGLTALYLMIFLVRVESNGFNNLVNTAAFWPQYIQQSPNILQWMILGMMGVLVSTVSRRKYMIAIVTVLTGLCIYNQVQWHTNLYNSVSQPSGLVEYVQSLGDDTCIALNSEGLDYNQLETLVKYKYYLYILEPGRVVVSSWRESGCEVLLTFDARMFADDEGLMIGKETSSGLYVIVKRSSIYNSESQSKQYINFLPSVDVSPDSGFYK